MKNDKIDDTLREVVMPNLGMSLDNLCNTYTQFFNSNSKVDRLKLLGNLRLASVDCVQNSKRLIEMFEGKVFEGPLPSINKALASKVQYAMKYSQPGLDVGKDNYLHGAYLQLTQLAKLFVGITPYLATRQKTKDEIKQETVQYLFQIFVVCNDISALCLITSAEPEKNLAQ